MLLQTHLYYFISLQTRGGKGILDHPSWIAINDTLNQIAVTDGPCIHIFSLNDGSFIRTFTTPLAMLWAACWNEIESLLYVFSFRDRCVHVLDMKNDTLACSWKQGPLKISRGMIYHKAGQLIVADKGAVHAIDTKTGSFICRNDTDFRDSEPELCISDVAFAPHDIHSQLFFCRNEIGYVRDVIQVMKW